jgi:hypothetical protein
MDRINLSFCSKIIGKMIPYLNQLSKILKKRELIVGDVSVDE